MRTSLSARVSADIVDAARSRAAAEGLSLSAIVERALAEYLKAGAESPDKSDWAVELKKLESRLSQVEAQLSSDRQNSSGRKGKRR